MWGGGALHLREGRNVGTGQEHEFGEPALLTELQVVLDLGGGETVILPHPPLPLVGVSIRTEEGMSAK